MLKVTLHYGKPGEVTHANMLGRMDIAYAKLDARADYKVLMFTAGVGEQPPVRILDYPRWSASIWDLVARAIRLTLNGSEDCQLENPSSSRRGAFIEDLTAVIEHWPDGFDTRRSRVATAHVKMGRRRGHYTASFEDDLTGTRQSGVFLHRPPGINAWDLLTRAYAWTLTETFQLPPRPTLYTPIPVEHGGASYVCLDTVAEPAATGIRRWLAGRDGAVVTVTGLTSPCVPEGTFVEFLCRAV